MSLIKYSAANSALKYIKTLMAILNDRLMLKAALSIVSESERPVSDVCSAVNFETVVVIPEAVIE